jgi:2'-5' RNA ligase
MRCFISINMPEEVKEEVVRIQRLIPDFHGKLTEKENLHLILKFLGDMGAEKIKSVKDSLGKIKFSCISCELDDLGVFSEKSIRIVWVEVKGMEGLQSEIDRVLGEVFAPEIRFMGHLTIARVKHVRDKDTFLSSIKRLNYERMKFLIDAFSLVKSTRRPVVQHIKKLRIILCVSENMCVLICP